MSLSQIGLCSRALMKIGAQPISSFDDGTAEADIAQNLYPHVRDYLLSLYPWSFATAQQKLARLSTDVMTDYQYAYQLPLDFMRALSVGDRFKGQGGDYRIQENRLHTDQEEVILTYIFRPEARHFPPYFNQVLMTYLASEFCLPLTESATRSEAMLRLGEKQLQQARTLDAQQQTPRAVNLDMLVEVRG